MVEIVKRRRHLWVPVLASLCVLVVLSVGSHWGFLLHVLERERDFAYGVPISISNKSNEAIIAIMFPVILSCEDAPEKKRVEQVNLERGGDKYITYYLGKETDLLKNVAIGIAVWKASEDFSHIQKEPYLVKTFYDPEFEIGPEEYEICAELIVE